MTKELTTIDIPAMNPATIAAPDLGPLREQLTRIDFDAMLSLRATDEATSGEVATAGRLAADCTKTIKAAIREPKEAANKLHKFFTQLESSMCRLPLALKAHADTELSRYEQEKAAAARELERKLQEQANAAARVRQEAENEARLAQIAAETPWLLDDAEAEPLPVVEVAAVSITPMKPDHYSVINRPWDYEVTDKIALLKDLVSKLDADPSIHQYLDINDKAMTTKVRQVGVGIADLFAGIKAVRPTSIRTR